jgi:membrane-bound metal-dependent hydrolase YbcI (DUF457 family)
MFFWFLGGTLGVVWLVFRDPRFDVRLLAVGAVLPELDALFGGARVMHTLIFSLVLLAVVMAATVGRRAARKLWLGLPIGTMLHLVLDGAWAEARLFWWPFGGWSFEEAPLPSAERGWWNLLLEAVGVAILVWFWRRGDLRDPARRRELWRTGRLYQHLDASGRGGVEHSASC